MVKIRKFIVATFAIGFLVVAVGVIPFLLPETETANAYLTGFNPNNIMSDLVMGNKNTMTEAQIQSFLKSKNPCNYTDLNKVGGTKQLVNGTGKIVSGSYSWNVKDNHFVCMADDIFGGETAAHIIWQAAQDYSVNPQVLIVLLQKEQGLVTDTFPNSIQYRSATGFGCPDTATCDPQYFGLQYQIRSAANLFRTVLNGGWSNYPVGSQFIQFSPDASCGGSWLYIENRATSALYRYTPYQPNAGALAAGWGEAKCGAYGNRNFYNYFTEWFGSTQTTDGKSEIQSKYDSLKGVRDLGNSLSGVTCGLQQDGCYQPFSGGTIYWTKTTGATFISGGILDRWVKLGTEWGRLGYPTSDEIKLQNGAYQSFQVGYIYWTPNTGAWDISGGIYDKWFQQGTEWGSLGYPTSGEQRNAAGETYQEFEKGRIYWTAQRGAWIVLN